MVVTSWLSVGYHLVIRDDQVENRLSCLRTRIARCVVAVLLLCVAFDFVVCVGWSLCVVVVLVVVVVVCRCGCGCGCVRGVCAVWRVGRVEGAAPPCVHSNVSVCAGNMST